MKAVVYHADAFKEGKMPKGIYRQLIKQLRVNVNKFDMPLIHLTVNDHDGLGDENYSYKMESVHQVIWNREKCIVEFLKNHADPNEEYLFLEPDFEIQKHIPRLTTDLCLLLRGDDVALTPAWRLCKKNAYKFFEESLNYFPEEHKDWHGDSQAWNRMYANMGSPKLLGLYQYNGISIELRPYGDYASKRGTFSKQYKGGAKTQMVDPEWLENWRKEQTV